MDNNSKYYISFDIGEINLSAFMSKLELYDNKN